MEIDVFVSYHTESSKSIVESIVNKLEGNGVRCWYAPRDVEGSYAGSITKAIKKCKAFLLVLNTEASESKHVLNEIEIATERLDVKAIFPFRITEGELSDDAEYYLKRIHWIDATTPEMEDRINELVTKIVNHIGRGRDSRDEAIENAPKSRLVGEGIYIDKDFKGREEEIEIIHKNLTSKKNKFFLVGMGGCGKSELARKYCEVHEADFENIVWISYNQSLKETIISDNPFSISGILRSEHLDKSAEEYFEYKLGALKRIADEKTLLVIDNFDVTEDEKLEELCSGRYAVLFTTRYRDISNRFEQLLLDTIKLDEEMQLELFMAIHKRRLSDDKIEEVKEILKLIDGHVLSIRVVAATMSSNRVAPKEMLEILKNGSAEKVHERLEEMLHLSNLSDEEMYVLKNLSLVTLQGIDTSRFADWCGIDSFRVIDDLVQKSWIILDEENDIIHLHPIVSDLAFEELSKDYGACERFLEELIENCEEAHKTDYYNKQWLMCNVEYICKRTERAYGLNTKILMAKARMLFHLSLYEESITLYESILKENLEEEEKRLIYARLAHQYCLNGYPEKAIKRATECISEFFNMSIDEMTPEDIYVYKGVVTRLVEANRYLKKYDIAVEDARKVMDVYIKKVDSEVNRSIVWGKYHLARTLCMRGKKQDLEECEMLLNEALELCEKEKSEYDKSFCLEVLGQKHMFVGDFEKALHETRRAYDSRVLYCGICHVDTAINRVFLANIYRSMGNEEEAAKYYNEAIEVFRKCGTFKLAEHAQEILESGKIGYVS